jgi:hypothetical protein
MALAMKEDEAFNPAYICRLGAQAVVFEPQAIPHPIQEPGRIRPSGRRRKVIGHHGITPLEYWIYIQHHSTYSKIIGQSNNPFGIRYVVDFTLGVDAMSLYWRVFNFLIRRVVAPGFVIVGTIVALGNLGSLLPGGTINVNGAPTDDIVFRAIGVFMPLLVAALGIALFRAPPFTPNKQG